MFQELLAVLIPAEQWIWYCVEQALIWEFIHPAFISWPQTPAALASAGTVPFRFTWNGIID